MVEQARVTSIDALETFRSGLVLYISKSICALDEILYEVKRTRTWLESEQLSKWRVELRRCKHVLDQAEGELYRARLSPLQDNLVVQQRAVRRAREKMKEAEDKFRCTKSWLRNYDSEIAPYAKKLESLRELMDEDLPKAVAFLRTIQKTLEAYSTLGAPPKLPVR